MWFCNLWFGLKEKLMGHVWPQERLRRSRSWSSFLESYARRCSLACSTRHVKSGNDHASVRAGINMEAEQWHLGCRNHVR